MDRTRARFAFNEHMANACTFNLHAACRAAALGSLMIGASCTPVSAASIPKTEATNLEGRTVSLPKDLPAATVLILGFSRHSSNATTAWEKPTRAQLAHLPGVTFYDMAMLAEVPRLAQGFVIGRVRKAVPDVLKPNFLTLTDQQTEWKQAAGFDPKQEDVAYVMLVDHTGAVRWSTHEALARNYSRSWLLRLRRLRCSANPKEHTLQQRDTVRTKPRSMEISISAKINHSLPEGCLPR